VKLDRTKNFGTITGHEVASYEQGGMLFDGAGESIGVPRRAAVDKDRVIQSADLESAKSFLSSILANGPLSKPVIFKAAEGNNQSWDLVKQAAAVLPVVQFQYQNRETWKLPSA
jgi:hypothetical protein